MFLVLFHMFYLFGKYVYDSYLDKKANTPSSNDTKEGKVDSRDVLNDNKVQVAANDMLSLSSAELPSVVKFSPPAYIQRYLAVMSVLNDPKYSGKLRKVVDFGCAELSLLPYLKNMVGVEEIFFVDVDRQILECNRMKAAPLTTDYLQQRQTQLKIEICEGSVIHSDKKLKNTDAVICIELIEHLHDHVLSRVPFNIFGYIRPKLVIVTTPNAEFNVLFPDFNRFRHPDHKFEWTRKQFEDWAKNIVREYPFYNVSFQGICYGPEETKHLGACSQMAIFELNQEVHTIEHLEVEGLFQTVDTYIYSATTDDRSDTQKVLDEMLYYINFLSDRMDNTEELQNEIELVKLQNLMKNGSISLEVLKNILYENGFVVEDRESGPVIIVPENSEFDMNSTYTFDNTDDSDPLSEDEEPLIEEYDTMRDVQYEGDNWNEESIIILSNQTVSNHENSYLFDGEHSTDHLRSFEKCNADVHTAAVHTADVHTADAADVSAMVSSRREPIYQDLRDDYDICASNTTETNNVAETDDDIITSDVTNFSLQPVSQDVSTNLSSVQDNDVISSFQSYRSISRSSTSPGLLYSPELDDSLISQNLLNNSFHRSEIPNEATTIVKLPRGALPMNEVPSLKEEDEPDLSVHTSLNDFEKNSINIKSNSVDLMKHRVLENIPNDRMLEMEAQNVSIIYDKPQSTSSPRCNKLFNMHTVNVVKEIVHTKENSHLYNRKHVTDLYCSSEKLAVIPNDDATFSKCSNKEEPIVTIKQSCLENDNLIYALESYTELVPIKPITTVTSDTDALKDTSRKFLHDSIVTETNNLQTTSSNKNVTSKHETDANCSSSNNSQQELCLESEVVDNNHSISVDSLQEEGNKETVEKENLIKHETDIVGVQKIDTHCILSLDDAYACRKSKITVIKPYNDDTEICLQNRSEVLGHPSGESFNPPRELLSTKSWSNSKCPSVCAKENSCSDDSFKSCEEDTNNKVVQFASPLSSDENVGCDTKDSTNKDINMSSIARLIASPEAKLSSPVLETPPDSWSHEIVDSGYPNSASGQDITPENDLSSIAQDHIPDIESPSVAEGPRLDVLEPIEVENGDLANNNRDDEGNNMMAADAINDIEGLQPLIDVLENDLENENDIYALENGFPIWLLRILDMANPLDFDAQPRQNLRVHHEVEVIDYMGYDEGFDSSSSDE